jgi:predicted GIY-YIG superfamily endonuclease
MKPGYTYIMGSHTGTLYIGVTSDIYIRVQQHKNGTFEGFSKKYGCTRLLYYESHEDKPIHLPREATKRLAPRKEIKPDPHPKPRLQRPGRNLGLEAHHRQRKNEPLKAHHPTSSLCLLSTHPQSPSS